jgi:branched-chain amino acid transport system substrate-binding protein
MRVQVLALCVGAGLWGACTLTTGGFEECETSADCAFGRLCTQGYCVVDPVPEGCGRSEGRMEDPSAVQLGLTFPLLVDGAPDETETEGLHAVLLALSEINQRDPFAISICDNRGEPELAKKQAEWLIEQRKVKALFTSWSSLTLAVAQVAVPRNTVVMSATATSPDLSALADTNGGPVGLVWRTAPSDAIQGRVITDLLLNDPNFAGVTKVGILYVDDPYGQGLAEVITTRLAEDPVRQLQTKAVLFSLGGEVDGPLGQLDAFDPDLTVLVAFPEDAVRLLTGAGGSSVNLTRAAGHRWFFTDSTKVPSLISGIPDPAEIDGAWGTAPAQGAGAAYNSFKSRFESTYGRDPDQVAFVSHNYDAVYVVALGAAWAQGDGAKEITGPRIAQGMTRLSSGPLFQLSASQYLYAKAPLLAGGSIDIAGASGDLDFDPATGEAPAPIEVWMVQAGAFVTLQKARNPPGD